MNWGKKCLIYERMRIEYQRIEEEILSIERQLEGLPEGSLTCARNATHYKWYYSDGHGQIYIPKRNRGFAEQLAMKKYLVLKLKELRNEKRAIESYLEKHDENQNVADELLINNSEYQKLLLPNFKPLTKELQEWEEAPYPVNQKYPQQLIHKTTSGKCVRSKSEAIISTLLSANKIPFRYECELKLGEIIIFPDFTILHPETRKIYYWEHFGRMDDEAYNRNVPIKLQTYISQGIIPSVRLITTYETMKNPLSAETVERIIKEYFL